MKKDRLARLVGDCVSECLKNEGYKTGRIFVSLNLEEKKNGKKRASGCIGLVRR